MSPGKANQYFNHLPPMQYNPVVKDVDLKLTKETQ